MMGKATEAVGDVLTGFSADLDEATLAAVFADPRATRRGARQRHDPDAVRHGAYQRTSGTAQPSPSPSTPWPAKRTCRTCAPPPYPGAPRTTKYQYHFVYGDGFGREIQRTARAAPDPPGSATARWATSGWTVFDNKGRPGPHLRAVLLLDERLRVRRRDGGRHGHALRPAGPRCRHAASRQQLGEDDVRPVARAEVGPRRHGSRRRPALRPRRRRLFHPAARRARRSPPGTTCGSAASTVDARSSGSPSRTRRARQPRSPPPRPPRTATRRAGRASPSPTTGLVPATPSAPPTTPRASHWPSSTSWAGTRRNTATGCR